MKFCTTCLLVTGVAVLALNASGVFAGVAGGAHDFTSGYEGAMGDELCLPCHTAHHADSDVGPLWNHAVPAATDFTMYEEGAVLDNESLMCLGCHDGQTAIDSFGGQTGTTTITGDENIGRDLTDDHPVGIPYGTSTRYAAVGTMWGTHPGIPIGHGGLPLYGTDNTIECTTCHTPHSNTNGNFLRVNNTGSALCIACHISW